MHGSIERERGASERRAVRHRRGSVLLAAVWLITVVSPIPPAAAAGTGAGLRTDGLTSHVRVADSPSLRIPVGLTAEAWIKPSSVTRYAHVMGKGTWEMSVNPSGGGFEAYFEVETKGTWQLVTSGPLALGQWYHLRGTYDGVVLRLFIGGEEVDRTPVAGPITASTQPLRIGASSGSNDIFDGEIDEVRLSTAVRSSTSFTLPKQPFVTDADTVGLWHLDEGAGTTTADSSGLGNNGTLVNGPAWSAGRFTSTDTTAPQISTPSTATVTGSQAVITWTTDEPATSQIELGPDSTYGTTTPLDPSLVTSHSVTVKSLTPQTQYHLRGRSTDAAGNTATSSDVIVTTTAPSAALQAAGEWSPITREPLVAVHSTLLYTGEILMWDAWEIPSHPRLWNPSTNTWTEVPNPYGIFCSGHATLPDGRVLVFGGHAGPEIGIPETFIFDPATRGWSEADEMAYARWYPSATELADGRVVAISGNIESGVWADTPELFDPTTGAWSLLNGVTTPEMHETEYPLSFLLPSNQVLSLASSTGVAHSLDVSSSSWKPVATTSVRYGAAVMYRPGKILTTGGGTASGSPSTRSAAVLDTTVATPAWRNIASMASPRYMHNLVVLADGSVLAVGGSSDAIQTARAGTRLAELWNPTTETWTSVASMSDLRMYHSSAMLLPDGRVLVAGGGRLDGAADYPTSEIYSPPYLFKGPRPSISAAPATAAYGSTITVATPDSASIASASLTNLASVTHSLDQNQHYVPLTFTAGSGALQVSMPSNPALAPPGYYMLTIVNGNGVPSVSKIVHVSGTGGGGGEPDVTGPVVSGVSVGGVSGTSATVAWTTDEPADGLVEYGTTTAYGQASDLDPVLRTTHSRPLSGLSPATTYHYRVVSRDGSGNETRSPDQTFTTTAALFCDLTAPTEGTTVSGTVTVTASAGGGAGIAGVQLRVDGVNIGGEDTTAPYSASWNTTAVANGTHVLTAVARDTTGTTITSTPVTVTVSNTAPPPPPPPTTGLIAAYAFNETSGAAVIDATGKGHDGTTTATTRTTGKYGGALKFNGTTSWVTVADAADLDLTNAMTLEAWVRPAVPLGSSWASIIAKESSTDSMYGLYASTSNGRPLGYAHIGNGDRTSSGTTALAAATWTHLAVTYDGAQLRFYVNGTQVSNRATTGNMATSSGPLRIGGNAIWGEFHNGDIDEVRIYNQALTATQITTDMNTPL